MRNRLIAILCMLALLPASAFAGAKETIAKLAPSGLVFVVDKDGKALIDRNADKSFVPASVAKIVTAWLALDVLGGDYRFETRFYLGKDRVLHVRGGGDPFMVSEELALLAPMLLEATGKDPFKAIVIDTSYYPDDISVPGVENTGRSYNALNAALAVNFNTIAAIRDGKTVRAAEAQTPITPLAIEQFLARGPNGKGRISLAQEKPDIGPRYGGELLAAFIAEAGGKVEGDITLGPVLAELKPIYVHRQSRPLSEIVQLMLIGSNNFIANQLFLEVGAHRLGGPVSLEKSLEVANAELAKHGLAESVHLVEGSGISRDNRFTARGLAGVIDLFAPHAAMMSKTKAGSRYKTGTLSDVSTLAGLAETTGHGTVRFVIALPGGSGKLRFRLLSAIEKEL